MTVSSPIEGYATLTDNTQEAGEGALLLATAQNAPYREGWNGPTVSPVELMEAWGLEGMKVVGVTGTTAKPPSPP